MCFSLVMVVLRSLNTTTERFIADARHGVRDGYVRQTRAFRERTQTDARHGVRDGHARQANAIKECITADARTFVSCSINFYKCWYLDSHGSFFRLIHSYFLWRIGSDFVIHHSVKITIFR